VHLPGRALTARGKAFRFEARYASGLARLFDFTIRECAFIGGADYVRAARARTLEALRSLVDDLGLAGRACVASDPFFAKLGTAQLEASQHVLEQKIEICVPTGPDRETAVASVNVHGQVFGRGFLMRLPDGATAESACVGIGLERLCLAFVARHGLDPASWPESVVPRGVLSREWR
jgi:hypothetical protein